MDGKTMRGALKLGAEVTATVTALGHRLGLTAGAAEVVEGDEIAAVQTLLKRLAAGGQRRHPGRAAHAAGDCPPHRGAGGQYVMTVKGNQQELQERIQGLFAPERVYGITSLTREQAGPADLLRLVRGHWRIEVRHEVAGGIVMPK